MTSGTLDCSQVGGSYFEQSHPLRQLGWVQLFRVDTRVYVSHVQGKVGNLNLILVLIAVTWMSYNITKYISFNNNNYVEYSYLEHCFL